MNRKHFFLWLLVLTSINYIASSVEQIFMEQVVTLVEYWVLRVATITVLIILTPFYLSMYIRRFHDMALEGTLGTLITFIFLLSTCYNVVHSTSMVYNTILIIVNLLLLFIPGTKYRNSFGEPDPWPHKQIKEIKTKGFLKAMLEANIEQSERAMPINLPLTPPLKEIAAQTKYTQAKAALIARMKSTVAKLKTFKPTKPRMFSTLPKLSNVSPKKEEKTVFIVDQLRIEPKQHTNLEDKNEATASTKKE